MYLELEINKGNILKVYINSQVYKINVLISSNRTNMVGSVNLIKILCVLK